MKRQQLLVGVFVDTTRNDLRSVDFFKFSAAVGAFSLSLTAVGVMLVVVDILSLER